MDCDKVFQREAFGVDTGRPALKQLPRIFSRGRHAAGDQDRPLARSTSDLYRIISALTEKGVSFKVTDDPSIDTTSRTGKLVMGILALIAEFENDIRRERQLDGIRRQRSAVSSSAQAKLTDAVEAEIRQLRADGMTVPAIMKKVKISQGHHLPRSRQWIAAAFRLIKPIAKC